MEGCEGRVVHAAEWQGRLHRWLHDAGFCDTSGVGGTADVVLDLDAHSPAELADELDHHLDRREREGLFEALPAQLYPKEAGVSPSPCSGGAFPEHEGTAGGRPAQQDPVPQISGLRWNGCNTWRCSKHNVVQTSVHGDPEAPPVLFCISCGASVQHSHRPGKGLAGPCFGPRHPGLATQRSRLRRNLHPNSTSSPPPKLGELCEPSVEVRALWEGRLVPSEASVCADPAASAVYGLETPEALDMYRVAQLHGFGTPLEAVEFCRAEREREAQLKKSTGPDELD